MRFRLAPKSMTLDDLEQDDGRSPLFSNTAAVYNRYIWVLGVGLYGATVEF